MAKKAVAKAAVKSAGKAAKPAATKAACDIEKSKKNVVSGKPASALLCDVEHLMHIMAANDVTEIDIVDGSRKISLKRGTCVMSAPVSMAPVAAPVHAPAAVAAPAVSAAPAASAAVEDNFLAVKSPMVGTFYSAASPDSDTFVKVGDMVNDETVVCIIEAMKVMNEIKSEKSGIIKEILVENGAPVEFGQPLFVLE